MKSSDVRLAGFHEYYDEQGRVDCYERRIDGRLIHLYPGATRWRIYVYGCDAKGQMDKVLAYSAHVYETPLDASNAAIAWTKHPYPLPT